MREYRDSKWGYRPFSEWIWKNYDGTDRVIVRDFVKSKSEDTYFMIGTDSQNYSKRSMCTFTTVLIAYNLGRGGSVILHRDRVSYIPNLRQRLLLEAMRSLEVAWNVDSLISSKNIIEIHLDINSNIKFKSGQYKEELVGLVAAQGYKAIIKPYAFAASKAADRKC